MRKVFGGGGAQWQEIISGVQRQNTEGPPLRGRNSGSGRGHLQLRNSQLRRFPALTSAVPAELRKIVQRPFRFPARKTAAAPAKMPPRLPRPSLGGIQAPLSSTTTCSLRTTAPIAAPISLIWSSTTRRRRPTPSFSSSPFSTTAPCARETIPPESPRFIKVVEPPQSSEVKLPPIRGHLPVPRQIFSKRDGTRKVSAEHLERTVPVSAAERADRKPRSMQEARHRVHAASRRAALASGLQGLWARKQQRDKREEARSKAIQSRNRAAALAPDALDDVLTRSSVRASTAMTTAVQADPERLARAEGARQRHAVIMGLKSEARRDALAQLYVAAGSFIVDEAGLEAHIDKTFTDSDFQYVSTHRGQSIWDSGQPPVSVADMKTELMGSVPTFKSSVASKTTERQKKVAEELTGGQL